MDYAVVILADPLGMKLLVEVPAILVLDERHYNSDCETVKQLYTLASSYLATPLPKGLLQQHSLDSTFLAVSAKTSNG